MAPDLAMLVLIFVYVALVAYDTITTLSIERKSRRKPEDPAATAAAAPPKVTHFRSRISLASIAFELCLCGVMLGAVATWYYYTTALVQNDVFSTR